METRMDRIEKGIEMLMASISELRESQRESQKETNEQIKRTNEQLDRTDEQLNRTDEQLKLTNEQLNQTDEQLKRTNEQLNRSDKRLSQTEELLEKMIIRVDKVTQLFADLGIVQGEVAEDLFYRNVAGLFNPLDLRFERIRRNVKVKGRGEYDIVADDKGRVLVIEVKNKLSKRMVDEFLQKRLPRFKTLLPEYRDSTVLAGIGALVVKDDVGRYAEKNGLFVLTQTCEGGAALMNRKDFRPKEFS